MKQEMTLNDYTKKILKVKGKELGDKVRGNIYNYSIYNIPATTVANAIDADLLDPNSMINGILNPDNAMILAVLGYEYDKKETIGEKKDREYNSYYDEDCSYDYEIETPYRRR